MKINTAQSIVTAGVAFSDIIEVDHGLFVETSIQG